MYIEKRKPVSYFIVIRKIMKLNVTFDGHKLDCFEELAKTYANHNFSQKAIFVGN